MLHFSICLQTGRSVPVAFRHSFHGNFNDMRSRHQRPPIQPQQLGQAQDSSPPPPYSTFDRTVNDDDDDDDDDGGDYASLLLTFSRH